jgi:alpha-glucosidase
LRGVKDLDAVTLWHTFKYLLRKRRNRARFGDRAYPDQPATEGYLRPGPVQSFTREGCTVTVLCANTAYALTVLAPDLVRVRLHPSTPLPHSYAIARPDEAWPACDFEVVEQEGGIELRTARLICRVDREAGTLIFLDPDGWEINADAAGAGHHADGSVICEKRIRPDEHFYGLGERAFGLDLRGRRYETWHTDPRTYDLHQDPIHLCIPFLVGLHDGGRAAYGILFDNTFRGAFDLGAADPEVASFSAVGGELRYYFFYGPRLETVLERYTELTGRMELPPLWLLGYHQSRWSYYPEARVRRLAHDFRHTYRVPCDAIHLDIHYMEGYRCFTWDESRFPNPARTIADLHEQGFKVVTIIDPGIKVDPGYTVYERGMEEEVFCKLPDGRTRFKAPVWPGDCHFPDFTDPRVREWWGALYRRLVDDGVDGTWNDMNEPAIFGLESETMPHFVRHSLEGRGGDHAEAHNVYGMQMARATVEGLRRLRPGERPVCITRSGWAGIQRYATGWTGDNHANWDHHWLSIPMLLNLGLSGLALTGPDVGGFSGIPSGELFTRWLQMGVFLPFLRAHTATGTPDQEPWSWGEPYLTVNRRFIELRYRLLPYLYTAAWQSTQSGAPIVRPLAWDFQQDEETHALDDQFLCGDALLVAPVLKEGAAQRTVYLPAGTWYDFWSDERHAGPARIEVETPLERLPLFVRGGSVLPLGPVLQYVGEHEVEELELHLYPAAPGEMAGRARPNLLYEDDGRTQAYREGAYRLTRFVLAGGGPPPTRLELERYVEGDETLGVRAFHVVPHVTQPT